MFEMLMSPVSDDKTETVCKLSGFATRAVLPVGRWFEAYWNRRNNTRTVSQHSLGNDESDSEDEENDNVEIEEDIKYLRELDPKEWKDQDHYKVLGLQKLRNSASDDQIKKAYRKMVLNHHPDKRRSAGAKVRNNEDDYFTCITKAYEILGNPTKRRSFDSVDPQFDNSIPTSSSSKSNFYKVYSEAFQRNARWSTKQPVPSFGEENTDFDDVDSFYTFWYNFESWREFSYLDEEEKEKGENREERRYLDKQNKVVRQQRKKEEMARIRKLVDNAYNSDQRIQRHKEEEKNRREASRLAHKEAARARVEEEVRQRREQEEAERAAKAREGEAARKQAEEARRAKEEHRKAMQKMRESLHNVCKTHNYYINNDQEKVKHLESVDKLCTLLSLQSLEDLEKDLTGINKKEGRERFLKEVRELNDRLAKEQEDLLAASQKSSKSSSNNVGDKHWSADDLQLLVKAVKLFPVGTNQRWEVVAKYMNQHSTSGKKRQAKEVLAKAKEFQKVDPTQKEEINKHAFNKFEKTQMTATVTESAPSERFDTPAEQLGINPWTSEEQRLLEQALKTYPASTTDRWDRVAECVPGRNKKDCMKRYKELAEMVRAKKLAQVTNNAPPKK